MRPVLSLNGPLAADIFSGLRHRSFDRAGISTIRTIGEIHVFTLQDNTTSGVEPTPTLTFSQGGITAFQVQYWTGNTWADVPGGNVTGNNHVWRRFAFTPVSTDRIRVLVNAALSSYSRIIEVEAWTAPEQSGGYTVSGTVTQNAVQLSGVSVAATNGASCSGSDATGYYSCSVPAGWSGTVTPSKAGSTFTPTSRSYSGVAANQTSQDYAATAVPQGQAYYIYTDHLDTPRVVSNATGQTVWRWEQDSPFGELGPSENPSGLGVFKFNLRFPGQYFDQETGLFYNYFRDYDPSIGRYIQSDPIGLAGGINTYGYVGGNPLSYVDPTGEIGIAGAAILIGGVAWSAYSGYQASVAFNKAQQCRPNAGPDTDQNADVNGPTPGRQGGKGAKTVSNAADAYGQGLIKAIWGIAAAGAGAGNPYGAVAGIAGYIAGAAYGSAQSCTCP